MHPDWTEHVLPVDVGLVVLRVVYQAGCKHAKVEDLVTGATKVESPWTCALRVADYIDDCACYVDESSHSVGSQAKIKAAFWVKVHQSQLKCCCQS